METEDSASAPVDPRLRATKAPRPELDARPNRGLGSWPVIIVGLLLTALGFVLTSRTAPCADFHQGTQFSGSDARLAKWIGSCGNDLGEARATLLADGVLIAGYAIAAGAILRRWWPLYQAPGLKRRERLVIALPFVTAAIDVLENIVTGSALGANDTRFTYPDNLVAPTLVSTLAWLKMLAYGLGLLCVAAVCLLAYARRKESAMPTPRPDQPIAMKELVPPTDLGVCCSGGGIRAAAFALGALDQLERAGIMDRARWLAAVSGGNYAATSWTLARVNDRSGHAAADVIDWLNEPIPYSKTPQHSFLRNGPGGLGRSIIAALIYVAFNVAVLGALVAAVAWPIGRLIGSPAIQPQFHVFGALPPSLDIRRELWLPAVVLLGLAGILLLVSALPSWQTSWLWRPAVGLAAIGAAVGLLTVVIPWAMAFVGNWVRRGDHDFRAATTGLAALFGALGVVWRLARKPVLSRFSHKLPYLGGVLLGIAGLVWAGKVATDAATGVGLLSTMARWAFVVAAFVAVYLFVGITHPSIHRIYRKRLRRSFGVRRHADGFLYAPHQRDQITWDQLPESDPELVVCCAHRARRHRPRRPARRHVHDLASRGLHRRLRHLDREVLGADARGPGVRAGRCLVDGDVRRRLCVGDGPVLPGHDECSDGRAQPRPRDLAAQPPPHIDPRRVSQAALRLPVQGDPRLVQRQRSLRVRRRWRALGQPWVGRVAAPALRDDHLCRRQRR